MTKPLHRAAIAIAAAYLIALALIVFWPTPVDRPEAGTLDQFIAWMHHHGVPHFLGYSQIEFSANIVLFMPFGYLVSIWFKNGWVGLVAGSLTSCFIELSQGVLLPSRFASGLDVLANTLGAGVGAAIYYRLHHRPSPAVEPVETRPAVELVETRPAVEPVETQSAETELVETTSNQKKAL